MDVDYCFEARLRGFQLMQVPVSLQHEENRTTRSLWEKKPDLRDHIGQNMERFYAKWKPFYPAFGVAQAGGASARPPSAS
jgi:GT2 family glycosyltransferase